MEAAWADTLILRELRAIAADARESAAGAGGPGPRPPAAAPGGPAGLGALLSRLDFLFAGDPVLERALEHVDNGDVCRVVAPSGRGCWLVTGASGRRRGA
jgi:hypothetical protein